MPNRILKESICTSDNLNDLSAEAEVLFYRLIVNCDDYGRFDGRLSIIRSRCFPLRIDSIDESTIALWVKELEHNRLIHNYTVDGKPYLSLLTWDEHQRIRAQRSKYPSPNGRNHIADADGVPLTPNDSEGQQVVSVGVQCGRNPIQSNPIQSESPIPYPKGLKLSKYPPEFILYRKQVFAGLKTRRGYTSRQPEAEAKAISQMLAEKFTVDEILNAYDLIKSRPFYADKSLSMMAVRKDIYEVLKANGETISTTKKHTGQKGNAPNGAFSDIT